MDKAYERTGMRLTLASVALMALLGLSCSKPPVHQSAPVVDGSVLINTSALAVNTPAFYTYNHEGVNINFFVIRDGNETVSYFDACRTCYRKKLGYAYSDGHVVCRACNMSFSLDALDKGIGGCYPVMLEGAPVEGFYRIHLNHLIKHADLF